MSKVSNPLIGKSSGSVGGVVFSSWKGINVLKTKPESVANPNTVAQQHQRSVFKTAVFLFQNLMAIVNIGFMQVAIKKSAYNAFVAANLKNGSLSTANPNKIADKSKFVISQGTLPKLVPDLTSISHSDSRINVEWDTEVSEAYTGNEKVLYAVADNAGNIIQSGIAPDSASSQSTAIVIADGLELGQVYHLYLAFYQETTRKVSNTMHKSMVCTA